jgi:hypothetical protein
VRARLDPKKFIECAAHKGSRLPPIDGLQLPPPIQPDAYLWAPVDPVEGTEEFLAGPLALEAAVSLQGDAGVVLGGR